MFSTALLCCVNSNIMHAAGRDVLVARTLALMARRRRTRLAGQVYLQRADLHATRLATLRLVRRTGAARQIKAHDNLLRECNGQHYAWAIATALDRRWDGNGSLRAQCKEIDFGALPFMQTVELLQSTDVLAGIHGAGLSNGLFMRANATLIEILGEAFAELPTYAFRAYHYLAATGLRHRRLVVVESEPDCARAANAWCASQNSSFVRLREEEGDKPCTPKDRLIDCSVDVRWTQIVGALTFRSKNNPLVLHHEDLRPLEVALEGAAAHPPTKRHVK